MSTLRGKDNRYGAEVWRHLKIRTTHIAIFAQLYRCAYNIWYILNSYYSREIVVTFGDLSALLRCLTSFATLHV